MWSCQGREITTTKIRWYQNGTSINRGFRFASIYSGDWHATALQMDIFNHTTSNGHKNLRRLGSENKTYGNWTEQHELARRQKEMCHGQSVYWYMKTKQISTLNVWRNLCALVVYILKPDFRFRFLEIMITALLIVYPVLSAIWSLIYCGLYI